MEGPNYFRAAMEFFTRTKTVPGPSEAASAIQNTIKAPKFVLPDGGKVLDNGLKNLPDIVRLPYPDMAIEYFHKEDYLREVAEQAAAHHVDDQVLKLMTKGHCYRDKVVVIVSQENNGPIDISVISHVPDQKCWVIAPFSCSMPAEKGALIDSLETGILPVTFNAEFGLSKVWFEKLAIATLRGPIRAICELVEALSFSNINEIEIPAQKMTFTERRKKALPYDSYRMVVVNRSETIVGAGRTETGDCGERRQSREHTRRGHDRVYKTGKKIWINPMVVNAGVGGKIVKDYQLK